MFLHCMQLSSQIYVRYNCKYFDIKQKRKSSQKLKLTRRVSAPAHCERCAIVFFAAFSLSLPYSLFSLLHIGGTVLYVSTCGLTTIAMVLFQVWAECIRQIAYCYPNAVKIRFHFCIARMWQSCWVCLTSPMYAMYVYNSCGRMWLTEFAAKTTSHLVYLN